MVITRFLYSLKYECSHVIDRRVLGIASALSNIVQGVGIGHDSHRYHSRIPASSGAGGMRSTSVQLPSVACDGFAT